MPRRGKAKTFGNGREGSSSYDETPSSPDAEQPRHQANFYGLKGIKLKQVKITELSPRNPTTGRFPPYEFGENEHRYSYNEFFDITGKPVAGSTYTSKLGDSSDTKRGLPLALMDIFHKHLFMGQCFSMNGPNGNLPIKEFHKLLWLDKDTGLERSLARMDKEFFSKPENKWCGRTEWIKTAERIRELTQERLYERAKAFQKAMRALERDGGVKAVRAINDNNHKEGWRVADWFDVSHFRDGQILKSLNQAKESNFDRIKTLIETNASGYTAEHVGVLIKSLVDAVNTKMPESISEEKKCAIKTELLVEYLDEHTTLDDDVTLKGDDESFEQHVARMEEKMQLDSYGEAAAYQSALQDKLRQALLEDQQSWRSQNEALVHSFNSAASILERAKPESQQAIDPSLQLRSNPVFEYAEVACKYLPVGKVLGCTNNCM